jgi:alpha-tubulin suppressor-like RCC1 family protein
MKTVSLPLKIIVAVTACLAMSCPASAATVKHWGSYGLAHKQRTPVTIPNLSNVSSIDAGNDMSYVLERNGTLWAFGENEVGELGDGGTAASVEEAVKVVFPAGVDIVAIGEAESSGYAIDSTGQGWAWGKGGEESLCLGEEKEDITEPEKVPGMTDAAAVQGGSHHVLWLLKNGTVETCGSNRDGELGVGSGVRKSGSPIAVPGLSGVVEVSAGQLSSCARTASGAIYEWGGDENGQIGNGVEETGVYEPFQVPLPGPASEISCGGNKSRDGTTLALVRGTVYGWGADSFGQVGDAQTVDKLSPVIATATKALDLTDVVASGASSLGLSASGDVYAWGSNECDALGSGEGKRAKKYALTPLLVDSGVEEISGTAFNSLDW